MLEKSRDSMINKIHNSNLIFNFFIKDFVRKFHYIFVLIPDLNTGFTLRETISKIYVQQALSHKYVIKMGEMGVKPQSSKI